VQHKLKKMFRRLLHATITEAPTGGQTAILKSSFIVWQQACLPQVKITAKLLRTGVKHHVLRCFYFLHPDHKRLTKPLNYKSLS